MLEWNEEFETGSVIVDTQHRLLIEKINQLEKLINGPQVTKAACDDLISFLGAYVNSHFKFEEQCMEQARCPVHVENKRAHAAFLGVFRIFKHRYEVEGAKPELLKDLHSTVADWIQNHILTVDIKLKGCFK